MANFLKNMGEDLDKIMKNHRETLQKMENSLAELKELIDLQSSNLPDHVSEEKISSFLEEMDEVIKKHVSDFISHEE